VSDTALITRGRSEKCKPFTMSVCSYQSTMKWILQIFVHIFACYNSTAERHIPGDRSSKPYESSCCNA
jgi:hypothetical protein